MAGTIGRADIYGTPSTTSGGAFDPLSVRNANGASVAPVTQSASGPGTAGSNAPAVSIVALIVGLVVLRLAIELSERVD